MCPDPHVIVFTSFLAVNGRKRLSKMTLKWMTARTTGGPSVGGAWGHPANASTFVGDGAAAAASFSTAAESAKSETGGVTSIQSVRTVVSREFPT